MYLYARPSCDCAGVAHQDEGPDAAHLPEHVAPQAPEKKSGGGGGFLDALAALGGSKGRGAKQDTDGGFSMMISAPFNVQHNIHVQVDASAPTGFKGLPAEWDAMLSASGISKVRRPKAHNRTHFCLFQGFGSEWPGLRTSLYLAFELVSGDDPPATWYAHNAN